MLDIILYSREQILKEKESLPSEDKSDEIPDVPWGIISIKAQVCTLYPLLLFLFIARIGVCKAWPTPVWLANACGIQTARSTCLVLET